MKVSALIFSCLTALAAAAPAEQLIKRAAATVTAAAPDATYLASRVGQVDSFQGIPFAQ